MTPIERAARALHKLYTEEKERSGARDMPSWDELGPDGQFYFTHRARAVIAAIREPSENMVEAAAEWSPLGAVAREIFPAMIDALLAEGE